MFAYNGTAPLAGTRHFAVPGDVTTPIIQVTLIRDGAKPVFRHMTLCEYAELYPELIYQSARVRIQQREGVACAGFRETARADAENRPTAERDSCPKARRGRRKGRALSEGSHIDEIVRKDGHRHK